MSTLTSYDDLDDNDDGDDDKLNLSLCLTLSSRLPLRSGFIVKLRIAFQ